MLRAERASGGVPSLEDLIIWIHSAQNLDEEVVRSGG